MSGQSGIVAPDWPAPARVRALTTTRVGGASRAPYDSLNLGDHVGDDPEAVRQNRARLRETSALPAEPVWLKQVHGVRVIDAATNPAGTEADGAWTDRPGVVCAVLTADCLPIFLCDRKGTKVALLHAGWRGLAGGVIESGLRVLNAPPEALLAWLGPAIGPDSYEVGDDVRRAFPDDDPGASEAFRPAGAGRWFADVYALARRQLRQRGVCAVYGGERCTLRERGTFYSFRRDGTTGRMASLIWLAQ
jgi:YfiH family protein